MADRTHTEEIYLRAPGAPADGKVYRFTVNVDGKLLIDAMSDDLTTALPMFIAERDGVTTIDGIELLTQLKLTSDQDDTVAVFTLETTGSNGERISVLVGDRNPEGNITADPGTIYIHRDTATPTNSAFYQKRTAFATTTGWAKFGDEDHTIASHSDTTATGAELETLTDGSNADGLHAHAAPSIAHADTTGKTADDHHSEAHTVASHSDTTATGAELETLTDGSNADALHAHVPAAHNHAAADVTSGTFDDARIAESNVTQHEAAIDHDALTNFAVAEHRVINDGGSGTTELWSASKIDAELSAVIAGVDIKAGVDTTTHDLGNITLSGEQTLNGLLTSVSRVLVTEQTLPEDNGIYVTAAGAWVRAADADADAEVTNGNVTHVVNSGSTKFTYKYLLVTADPITVGTTGQTWEEHKDIDFGTTSGTAAEGNDSRIPIQDENDALVGTDGTPSTANPYVTDSDPRNTDDRPPTGTASGDLGGTYPNPTVNDGADSTAIHDNIPAEISPLSLVTVDGADHVLVEDASDSDNKKRILASDFLGTGAFVVQEKTDANDGETLALNTWTLINTLGSSFTLNLPEITALNDGQSLHLEFQSVLNRLILSPNATAPDTIALDGLLAGDDTHYEAVLQSRRFVKLTADFNTPSGSGPRWIVQESPHQSDPVKVGQNLAAQFTPLSPVDVFGSKVGKVLVSIANELLVVDGVTMAIGTSVLVGGQAAPVDNGLYNVGDEGLGGGGGRPFVLVRRTDAHLPEYTRRGLEIEVTLGTEFKGVRYRLVDPTTTQIDTDPWVWEHLPAPVVVQSKTQANDGETLALNTRTGIDTGVGGSFTLNLPPISPTNDGERLWLDFEPNSGRLTLEPDSADAFTWFSESLSAGTSAEFEAFGYARSIELIADLATLVWRVVESPPADEVNKAAVTVATFDPLPTVVASGTGIGKTLTATGAGLLTLDGVAMTADSSILVAGQETAADNGVYNVTDPGNGGAFILTRRTDAHHAVYLFRGLEVRVESGTDFADTHWRLKNTDGLLASGIDFAPWVFEPVEQINLAFGNAEDQRVLVPNSYVHATYSGGSPTFVLPDATAHVGAEIFLEVTGGDETEFIIIEASGSDVFLLAVGQTPDTLLLTKPAGVQQLRKVKLTATTRAGLSAWDVEEVPGQTVVDKPPVDWLATSPLNAYTGTGSGQGRTLTSDTDVLLSIDLSGVAEGETVLLQGQSPATDDGVYQVAQEGVPASSPWILRRRSDADLDAYFSVGFRVAVLRGNQYADQVWYFADQAFVVDSDTLAFRKVGGALSEFAESIVGDETDYNGTDGTPNFNSALYSDYLNLSPSGAARTLNSMDSRGGDPPITRKIIRCDHLATQNLDIAHEGTGVATNRFFIPGAGTLTLTPGSIAVFDYIGNRWRLTG